PRSEDLAKGILDNVSFDSYRVQLVKSEDIRLEGNGELLPSNADGSSKIQEAELQELSSIIKEFNEKYGNIEWGESDQIVKILKNIKNDITKDSSFIYTYKNLDAQNSRIKFKELFNRQLSKIIVDYPDFYNTLKSNTELESRIIDKLLNTVELT
ncbi:MAG: type I restriction endonuclease subunit R, partial [Helicobacter trogontum]|nr:type I restriction endonuclease subunit R [Helicobacter trogontum]